MQQIKLQPSVHFDADRLRAMCGQLEQDYVANGPMPHLHIIVFQDGVRVLDALTGSAREDGSPLRSDALYRIASMTKPVTSVAFLMLMEQGRVALDTPVADVLPELADLRVFEGLEAGGGFLTRPVSAPMRMIDLLRHTSGLTYSFQRRTPIDALYGELQLDSFHQKRSAQDYLAAIAALPLEFSPAEAWNYSIATDVLGIVVERLSGMDLETFFARNIFGPLGMDDTFFVVPPDKVERLTDGWMIDGNGAVNVYDRGDNSRWRMAPRTFSGGGGLVSSARDYGRFAQMLLGRGTLEGVTLLSAQTVAMMTRNHLPGGQDLTQSSVSLFSESGNEGIGFGLGVSVVLDKNGPESVGMYRWGGLLSTNFLVDPAENMVALLMTQLMPSFSTTILEDFHRLLYGSIIRRSEGEGPALQG
jgi:CubicO group peptidase (beta-lactamase class C family)